MRGYLIAYTGAHGTGKTYAAMERARLLKAAHPDRLIHLLQENTPFCPMPINGRATVESALWIFGEQLRREIELLARFDIVVTDRTVLDPAAYAMAAGMFDLAKNMAKLAGHYMHRYREIRFHTIAKNDHLFADGHRDTDPAWRLRVQRDLLALYAELGLDISAAGFFLH